ncbi:MAG: UDP-glucose 6-dehydrogenase [Candidatus Hydrogenedentota bacterium]|nr:MAG: UDP-glucose 6-dehydrogenase [Candidatus Hydrogenedentota bacterium]
MRLAVIGTGYVGLVSGTCFSELGHDVTCIDIDEAKIDALNRGELPIYEPGLKELVSLNVEQGRLTFSTDIETAVQEALVIFIAVGTPPQEDGTADLQYVFNVARSIGQHMNGFKIVVDKSTVPVGTARKVRAIIQEEMDKRGVSHDIDVVSNPEFLKEGAAIDDFMVPDRVVIGCDDDRTIALMKELYSHFAKNSRPIITMSLESAEMTKYAANAMLATKISFINEMAGICERVGADIGDVRNGIGSDSRIGYRFIYPGIGYGGSCFPKDVKALRNTAKEVGFDARLLNAVDEVNEKQKESLLEKIRLYYRDDLNGKKFTVWGLSFKPETDDTRESPALVMIEALAKAGVSLHVYDPKAMDEARKDLGDMENVTYAPNYYDALENTDALILATEWSFFRNPDFQRMKNAMSTPVIFDGRNVYNPSIMGQFGFDYFSIGREPILAHSNPS